MKRVTRARVDKLADLHERIKALEAEYDREIHTIKRLNGVGAYRGTKAQLLITEQSRSTTNWEVIRKQYKIPDSAIKRATRTKVFYRAEIVRPGESS